MLYIYIYIMNTSGEAAFVSSTAKVETYMTKISDSLDLKRNEGFIGWYPLLNKHTENTQKLS